MILLSSVLLLTGCTSSGGGKVLEGLIPTVKFERFDVQDVDFEQIQTDFVFNVNNPAPVDYPLSQFAYNLALAETDLLSGDDPDGLELTGGADTEVALPVDLTFEGIYALVEAIRGQDNLPWLLDGNFGFSNDTFPVVINYEEDGDFPALRRPHWQFQQINIRETSVSNIGLDLNVDVDNDHGSPLRFHGLDVRFSFGGTEVGRGLVEELGSVEGATDRQFTIPFDVDPLSVATAIASGQTQLRMRGTVQVDTPFGVLPLDLDEIADVLIRD